MPVECCTQRDGSSNLRPSTVGCRMTSHMAPATPSPPSPPVPNIRLFSEKLSPTSSISLRSERRKKEWLEDLEKMSDFLVIKSTAQQAAEGEVPVDTAVMKDRDGMPVLKFILDLRGFDPQDVDIDVGNDCLTLTAHKRHLVKEDEQVAKTKIRKFDLPDTVDPGNMHYVFEKGFMLIEMPFHLPPSRKPKGPLIYPIVTGVDGRQRIQLMFDIDKAVPIETVTCVLDGHVLIISSAHVLGSNADGSKRIFRKNFQIPDNIHAESAESKVSKDGRLHVQLLLEQQEAKPNYKCTIQTEQVW